MATPMGNPCGTYDGISFEEPVGSGGYQVTTSGGEGIRVFHIDWNDRVDFSTALVGGVRYNGNNSSYTAGKNFPGYLSLVCQSVAVEGLGTMSFNTDGDPVYPFAVVTATYKNKAIASGGGGTGTRREDVIATEEMDSFYESQDLQTFNLQWSKSSREIVGPFPNFKRTSLIRHVITDDISPTNKKAIIQASTGRVNSVEFLGVAPEFLLYEGAKTRRVITTDGRTTTEQPYRIVHTFLERVDASWQKMWDSIGSGKGPQWDRVADPEDFEKNLDIYEKVDFNENGLID